jgi:hypothetical protein
MIRRLSLAVLIVPLALAACGGDGGERNVDTLDDELAEAATGNGTDPMLTGALQDQIMVDPALAQQANGDAVRPPGQPYAAPVPNDGVAAAPPVDHGDLKSAPVPTNRCPQCAVARSSVTLGALAQAQKTHRMSACAANLRYAAGWANRLSVDVPLYPNARVIEAAGADGNGCALRAVSFSVSSPIKTMIDWYYTRTTKVGFASEHQSDGDQHILGGTRAKDDSAYVIFMTERADGGTDVDLIANNGV